MALLLILLATLVPFFMSTVEWAQASFRYVYTAGCRTAAGSTPLHTLPRQRLQAQALAPHRELERRILLCGRRISLLPGAELRDWLAFTLAAAVIQIITSFAIPARESKLDK